MSFEICGRGTPPLNYHVAMLFASTLGVFEQCSPEVQAKVRELAAACNSEATNGHERYEALVEICDLMMPDDKE